MKNNRSFLSRALMGASLGILLACAATAWHPARAADTLTISPTAAQPELNAMQAQPGQIVMFKGDISKNGANSHPAVVTRSWADGDIVGDVAGMVNLSVIPDAGHHVEPRTSVKLYATEADGDRATAKNDHVRNGVAVCAKPYFAYFVPEKRATRPHADAAGLAEVAQADQLSGHAGDTATA